MKILAIETSCDETAISIIEAKGGFKNPQFKIKADAVISQIKLHKKYGGVFPSLAKREHTKNLLPILKRTLKKSKIKSESKNLISKITEKKVMKVMEREPELFANLLDFIKKNKKPKIDVIAVTHGPGLEPALWTGLNFAKALAILWNKPLIPVNHMEGHLAVSLLNKKEKINFPALGLLLSGGHTELVFMKNWTKFQTIGQTRDDAVGEAYDKIARMLGLSYPGGPLISKLSSQCKKTKPKWNLPRPMINSNNFDFSFSGLKTAVLYKIQKIKKLTPTIKKEIAKEFEEAVNEVLLEKTIKAIKKYKTKTLILGGGVVANKKIRNSFKKLAKKEKNLQIFIPEIKYTGDNATMIAIAGYFRYLNKKSIPPKKVARVKANGNLAL